MREAAAWVAGFLGSAYGPGGGMKLVETPEPGLFSSGATALRYGGLRSPDLAPYVDLATSLQTHAGDQATGGVLLAARLVEAGLRLEDDGVARTWTLQGMRLGRRQALAILRGVESADTEGVALRGVPRDGT